jgi:PST family polysaccharide transporter
MGSTSRDAIWTLAYSSAVRLATLGVSIAIARLGGAHATGAFGVALQVTALGSLMATISLPQSLTRHLARSEEPSLRRRFLMTSAAMIVGLGAIVALVLMTVAAPISTRVYRDASLAPVVASCGALTLATAACLWLEGALQGVGRFDRLARWGVVLSVVDLVVGAVGALFGVVTVILGRSLTRLAAVAVAVARWGRDTVRARGDASQPDAFMQEATGAAAALLGFAGPALLAAGIVLMAQVVLRALLVRVSGLEAAGHYQAAESLAQGLLLLPGAASAALMRAVASAHGEGNQALTELLRRGLERLAGWNLPMCLLLIAVVPWLPEMIFGGTFVPAGRVLVLLGAAYGVMGPVALFGATMLGRGEVWTGVLVNLLWASVMLGMFGLIGTWGATGAAASVGAGYLALLAACLWIARRRWSLPLSILLPPLAGTLAALAIAATSVFAGLPPAFSAALCGMLALGAVLRWGRPSQILRLAQGRSRRG